MAAKYRYRYDLHPNVPLDSLVAIDDLRDVFKSEFNRDDITIDRIINEMI